MKHRIIFSIIIISVAVCCLAVTNVTNMGDGNDAGENIDIIAMHYVIGSRIMDNDFSNEFCYVAETDATTYPYDYLGALKGEDICISRLCSNLFHSDWVLLPFQCCDSCYKLLRNKPSLRHDISYENEIETLGMNYNIHNKAYQRLTTRKEYPNLASQLKIIFLGDTTEIHSTKAFFDSIGHPSFIIPYYVLLIDKFGIKEFKEPLYEELVKCDTMNIRGLHEFTLKYKS